MGNLKEVEVILRNKEVDVNGRDKKGLTPLMIAVNLGHLDIVKRLLEVPEIKLDIGAPDGDTALHYACSYNDNNNNNRVSIIKLLCQESRCSPSVVNKKNSRGDTPLMRAVVGGNLDFVRTLLEHPGIKLGHKNMYGNTALHMACHNNRVSIIKLLCQDTRCGPSVVNKKNSRGHTALMLYTNGVYYRHLAVDVVKELDIEGTDFLTKYDDGRTLIEVASRENRAEVLEYLLERPKVDSLKVIAAHNIADM